MPALSGGHRSAAFQHRTIALDGPLKDSTVESTTTVSRGGASGREVRFHQKGLEGIERVYIKGNRLYMQLYAAPAEKFGVGEWKPAFDSFELTDAPR